MLRLFSKIFLMIVMFASLNTIYSQTEWQVYQSETPLSKKAKLKTVKYKSYGYAAVGYVYEKQFVSGQDINLYWLDRDSYPIIRGIYFIKDGISYLESTLESKENWNIYSLTGIFRVSNNFDENGLTVTTKNAKNLNIRTKEIIKFTGFYDRDKYTFALQRDSKNNYEFKIEFDDEIFEISITSDYVKKEFFPKVDNLFEKPRSYESHHLYLNFDDYIKNSNDGKITFNNGDVFIGKVEIKDRERFIAREGKYTFSNGEIFIGRMYERPRLMSSGKWIFADSSVENRHWLKKYEVEENDLLKAETITDKHNLAISIYEDKQRKLQKEEKEKNKWKTVLINDEFGSVAKCYVKSPSYSYKGKALDETLTIVVYPPYYETSPLPIIRFVSTLNGNSYYTDLAIKTEDGKILRFEENKVFNTQNAIFQTIGSIQFEKKDANTILEVLENSNYLKISISAPYINAFGNKSTKSGVFNIDTKDFMTLYNKAYNICKEHK